MQLNRKIIEFNCCSINSNENIKKKNLEENKDNNTVS